MTEHENGEEQVATLEHDGTKLARAGDVLPGLIHLLPVSARPFFPGQAVPLLMHAKHWTKTLKAVGQTDHKILGVVLVEQINPSPFLPRHLFSQGH